MRVQDEILELLGLPRSGRDAPTLARIEDTLTEGYAAALALEAERWRLERRLGEVAREAQGGDGVAVTCELASISERLTSTDGRLAHLRGLLGTLQERAREARAAAPA